MNRIIYVGKHALTFSVSRHLHNSLELIFCTGGRGEMVFDGGGTLRYFTNDIVVVPPHLPHANMSATGFTNIHIYLDEATLNPAEPCTIPADPNGFLLGAFAAAFHYYSGNPEDRSVLLPLYGQLIAASLATRDQKPLHSELVQKLENDILENYPDCGYDLNVFLGTLPFSAGYVKKVFKKETGLTPLQYLTDKRLENAASNLAMRGGRGNISEIAYQCGFSEPLYFSRLFKRKYGVSPRSYASRHAVLTEASPPDDLIVML